MHVRTKKVLKIIHSRLRETICDSVSSLELLDDGGDDHAGGGAGDARLAVEDDGRGGRGALQDAHDLVEAALVRRSVLVQRDPQRLNLFVLPRGRKKTACEKSHRWDQSVRWGNSVGTGCQMSVCGPSCNFI